MGTHIDDLVNHVLYEDLDAIVLLGFSYGGMVVTGSLDALADRVRHVVYLDAFVPGDGDSLFGLLGLDDRPAPAVGSDWQVMAAPRVFDDPDEADFMNPRRTPQPVRCFTERVTLSRPLEEFAFGRTYIRATGDAPDAPGTAAFAAAAAHARSVTALERPRDRHEPHGAEQPARRTGGDPRRARLTVTSAGGRSASGR